MTDEANTPSRGVFKDAPGAAIACGFLACFPAFLHLYPFVPFVLLLAPAIARRSGPLAVSAFYTGLGIWVLSYGLTGVLAVMDSRSFVPLAFHWLPSTGFMNPAPHWDAFPNSARGLCAYVVFVWLCYVRLGYLAFPQSRRSKRLAIASLATVLSTEIFWMSWTGTAPFEAMGKFRGTEWEVLPSLILLGLSWAMGGFVVLRLLQTQQTAALEGESSALKTTS